MKIEGKYLHGTAREIAEYILADVLVSSYINSKTKFDNCDFAISDSDESYETLEELAFNSVGWYGIKKIDTGFDSNDMNLMADYYGGGNGIYNALYSEIEANRRIDIVEKMILDTLNMSESCHKDTVLIANVL